jgi:helicase MOV-10
MYGNIGGMTFEVEFTFRRTNLKIMHQGLDACNQVPRRLLFPEPSPTFDPGDDIPLVSFNPVNRDLNPEQQLAVSSILSIASSAERNQGPNPYIIYGPPGTGKTVTLVESIKQLIERYPDDRILVTAPSNEAADLFVSRLSAMPTSEMLRLNAFSRNERAVPRAVRDYSLEDDRGFVFPANIDKIGQYKVVVATCATASRLWNMLNLPRGFFNTIVCDECGHAWEPEATATVLNGLASDNTVIILAGDPKQLGPIVRSTVAKDAGLATSWLERLMGMPAYSKRGPGCEDSSSARGEEGAEAAGEEWRYDPMRVTKLLRNYRSHEAIIRLPNSMFYDNEVSIS